MKYVGVLFMGALGLLAAFLACDRVGRIDDPGTIISGMVTDSLTGLPIDSAIIQINDTVTAEPVYTDSAGMYTTGFMPYGTVRIFSRKTGYQTKSRTVTSSSDHLTIRDVDFELVPSPDSAR